MSTEKPAKPLSARQRALYDAIVRFWVAKGYGPTVRELRAELMISSMSVVVYNLLALADRGLIAMEPGEARTTRPMVYGTWWRDGRPVVGNEQP